MKLLLTPIIVFLIHLNCVAQNPINYDSIYNQSLRFYKEKSFEMSMESILIGLNNLPEQDSLRIKFLQLAGEIFYQNNNIEKALKYRREAFLLNKINKDSVAIMSDHIGLGQIYHRKFNGFPLEEIFSNRAIKLKDSAIYHYKKNINEFKHIKQGIKYQLKSHLNLSAIFSETNELEKAQFHISQAINGYKNLNMSYELDQALANKGFLKIYQKKYGEAEDIYINLIRSKRDTTQLKFLQSKKIAYGNLSYIYKKTNQFEKAYKYTKLKEEYIQRIYEKEKAAEITAIEARYNEQKARQEEALKTEKEREKKERFQLWFAIAALGAILIFLLGTILYRNSKLKAKNLSLALVRKELDQQREIQSLQKQHQNKIINATLDGREKERKDIAQALHDSVSSLLSSANLHLQVGKRKSPEAQNEIEKSQNIISEASDKIRDLSHQLISAVLLKFGLEYAVDNLCEKYSNEDLLFELETEDRIPRFEQAFEIKIHNIIEEFCNNIIKHSKATNASIRLHMEDNTIHITVKDNGVGFDTKKLDPKSGIGLSQIKARIESLEGEIDIQSITNKGTEINIKTPVLLA